MRVKRHRDKLRRDWWSKRRRTRQKKMGVSVGEESNWNILEQMVTLYWSDFRGKFLILIKHFLLKLV